MQLRYAVLVFLRRRPQPQEIDRFLEASRDLPLSYAPVGLAGRRAPGFSHDEVCVRIGRGEADYRAAVAALREWRQCNLGWTEIFPPAASPEPGTVVAILIRHAGFWSLNGARIVYALGRDDASAFGYAYGTLGNHAERGEEIFEVRLAAETGEVTYRLRAASRPRAFLAALGYPVTRALQARFRRHSAAAMTKAVRG